MPLDFSFALNSRPPTPIRTSADTGPVKLRPNPSVKSKQVPVRHISGARLRSNKYVILGIFYELHGCAMDHAIRFMVCEHDLMYLYTVSVIYDHYIQTRN